MIENKELGVKFAESEEEAKWYSTKEEMEQGIQMHKIRMKRAESDLKIPDRKLIQKFRNGAKALIKEIKQTIQVQEEILKFVESKIKKAKV